MKLSKKLLNILLACVFACACTQFTSKLSAAIPEYNGLYTLFTPANTINASNATTTTPATPATNTIGIGQSLKYSGWLENVYTYAPEENTARQVIAILWNKRLFEGPENALVFTETNNFIVSDNYPTKSITPQDLGKIIKYIREFNKNGDYTQRRTEFLAAPKKAPKSETKQTGLSKDLRGCGTKDKAILEQFIIALEELKYDTDNFIPEIAESILWAFFESKIGWGEQEFKACLNEINPSYWEKLNTGDAQADYYTQDSQTASYTIDETVDKTVIENITNRLIDNPGDIANLIHYDALTRYLIKSEKTKNIPTKVSQVNLKCKHPVTGVESADKFPTCFESSILDILSIFTYDSTNLKYDPNILPEAIRNGVTFKSLIDQVFKVLPGGKVNPEDKEFILAENINKSMQTWTNLISNVPELKYNNNNYSGNYDLIPSFENFVKVLNKFLDLGFTITDTKDTLEISCNNSGTINQALSPVTGKITVQKDKLESWQTLFDLISEKLSTKENGGQRQISFEIEKNEIDNVKFRKIDGEQDSSICVGPIKISIGATNLHIVIKKNGIGHAYIICPERDKSKLAAKNLENLKNRLIDSISSNKNLIPLFMFLPYVQTIENMPQIEELLYYSFDLKDHNTKLKFLEKIFESDPEIIKNIYCNQSIYTLVVKLINLLPENDSNFILPLSKYLDNENDKHDKLYWQNEIESKIVKYVKTINKDPEDPNNYLLKILPFLSVNNKNQFLRDKLREIFQNQTIKNRCCETTLHIASKYNKVVMTKILSQNPDIDINAKDVYKETPLHFACQHNSKETVEILLRDSRINVIAENANKETPLHLACKNNQKEIVETLLNDARVIVNAECCNKITPLHLACGIGCTEIVEILLKDPDVIIDAKTYDNKFTPLHFACCRGYKKIVEILLKNSKVIVNTEDSYKKTPLHLACWNNQKEVIEILLKDKRIIVNAENCNKETPLHLACEADCKETVEILLRDSRINVIAENDNKEAPLHTACRHNHKEIVEILLKDPNVNVNAKNKDNWTPLNLACRRNRKEIVEILLKDSRVNINAEDKNKETSLHIACRSDFKEIVKILLDQHDIDIFIKNKDGKTAKDLAKEKGNKEIARLLEREEEILEIKNDPFFLSSLRSKNGEVYT